MEDDGRNKYTKKERVPRHRNILTFVLYVVFWDLLRTQCSVKNFSVTKEEHLHYLFRKMWDVVDQLLSPEMFCWS